MLCVCSLIRDFQLGFKKDFISFLYLFLSFFGRKKFPYLLAFRATNAQKWDNFSRNVHFATIQIVQYLSIFLHHIEAQWVKSRKKCKLGKPCCFSSRANIIFFYIYKNGAALNEAGIWSEEIVSKNNNCATTCTHYFIALLFNFQHTVLEAKIKS